MYEYLYIYAVTCCTCHFLRFKYGRYRTTVYYCILLYTTVYYCMHVRTEYRSARIACDTVFASAHAFVVLSDKEMRKLRLYNVQAAAENVRKICCKISRKVTHYVVQLQYVSYSSSMSSVGTKGC